MLLEVFSNLSDSMILFGGELEQRSPCDTKSCPLHMQETPLCIIWARGSICPSELMELLALEGFAFQILRLGSREFLSMDFLNAQQKSRQGLWECLYNK